MSQYTATWPDGTTVRWRTLSWQEYNQLQHRLDRNPIGAFVDLYQQVSLPGNPPADQVPAGVARFVALHVSDTNPFGGDYRAVKRALDEARGELGQSYLLSSMAVISHLFGYKTDEIMTWDAQKVFRHLAMAEFISGKPHEPEPPYDPKAPRGPNPERLRQPLNQAQQMTLRRVREARGIR